MGGRGTSCLLPSLHYLGDLVAMGIWRPHIHIHRPLNFDGVRAFYMNAFLRSMVFSLAGIFVPIYIFQIGRDVWGGMSSGLLAVAGFYILLRLIVMVVSIPISKVIETLGFRRSVLLSNIFLGIYILALMMAERDWRFGLLAAVGAGLNIPLYWTSRFSVVSQDSRNDDLGKQISFMAIMEHVAGVLGPLAGGLMLEKWGFMTLYGTTLVILTVSVIPLFFMPHHVHRNGVSLSGFFLWLKDRQFFHQSVAAAGRTIDDYATAIVWPLVIMFIGVSFGVLGGVFSLVTLLATIMRYVSGIWFDRLHRKGGYEDEAMFAVAGVGQSLSWVARIFALSVGGVVLIDSVAAFFGTTYRNISDDYMFLGGKRMSEIAYFTYREMVSSLAAVLVFSGMVVGVYFGVWKEIVFAMAAMWVLLGVIQGRESNLS